MKLVVLAFFTFGSLALYAQTADGGITRTDHRDNCKVYGADNDQVTWCSKDKKKEAPTSIEAKTCKANSCNVVVLEQKSKGTGPNNVNNK